jgi:hypothetical protein
LATKTINLSEALGSTTISDGWSYSVPNNTYYDTNRISMVLPASVLTTLGVSSGDTLTKLGHYVVSLGGRPSMMNMRISLAHTTSTSISSWPNVGSMTLCYGPTSITMSSVATNAYLKYTLSTTFDWNGSDNLLIDISRTDEDYKDQTGNGRIITNFGQGNVTLYGRQDNVNYPTTPPTNPTSQFLDLYLEFEGSDAAVNTGRQALAGFDF